MEQGGALIPSLFTLCRIAYSIKEDRNDMATWNSRGLRGSTLEDMINKTNEKTGYLSLTLKLTDMAKKKHPERDYRAMEDFLHNYRRRIRT